MNREEEDKRPERERERGGLDRTEDEHQRRDQIRHRQRPKGIDIAG
jgi:hypothetical protein